MTSNYHAVVLADSPIRYYRLNDTTTTATDSGSQAQNGTLHGTITQSVAGLIRGDTDNCMTFNGSTGYISLPTTSLPTGASAWTLEAWCKIASIPASGSYALLSFGSTGSLAGAMIALFSNGTTAQFLCDLNGGNHAAGAFTVAVNQAYHVCATYDGTNARLYVNSALAAGPSAFAMAVTLTYADIGSQSASFDFFPGSIDEPAIYSSALSAQQVLNHYLAGIAAKVLGARTRLSVLNTKSLGSRTRLRVLKTLTLGIRTRLITSITKSVGARTLLRVQKSLSTGIRLVLHSFASKSLGIRTLLRVQRSLVLGSRARISVLKSLSVGLRVVLHSFASRTLGTRTLLRVVKSVVVGVRLHLFTSFTKSVGVRVRLAGIASGKFGVWANGTGTATYSSFRATQYPDPSLSLAPIIPRVGTSLAQWNALTPTNTTLGVDISTDGVNWIDISAGASMTFDGSTGYITIPTTSLPTGASPWTLETWCELSSLPASGYHAMIGFGTYSAQQMAELSIQSTGTAAQFVCTTYSGDIGGPFTIQAGTVYHVVGTYDGSSTRLYVNGVLVAGPSAFTLNIALAFASIGAGNATAQDFFPGTLDENAIYSTVLSATQVLNHYNAGIATPASSAYATTILADAPIRYYHLDDTNTTAIDGGSQAQNGALHGGISKGAAGLITSRNGLQMPQYFVQPDPTIDGFASNTSPNYTSTFRTGGSTGTWTYDTVNSRIVVTGGTNAIYVNASISRADVDFYADLDRSDAGGLVWRYVDANNFYYLLIADKLASSGTPNTITLYRVASNVQTQLAQSSITCYRGMHYRFRVTMLGSVITASMDGAQLINYTDASPIASPGKVGLFNNGGVVGSRYSLLWIQPQGDLVTGSPVGDIVTGGFVYTRARLATTDPTVTPQVADLTTLAAGPNIRNGVSLANIVYNAAYIGKTYDDLSKASNYSWYIGVDTNGVKTLYFRQNTAVPSPWILQSNTLGLGSDLEHDTNLVVETANNTLYRNRQILLNVIETGTNLTITIDNVPAQIALQAIQGGTGIVEETEDVSTMGLNVAAATTYGQQLLARNGLPGGKTVTFKTYRTGIDILQTLTAFVPEENMNDVQLLVTEVDIYLTTSQVNGATVPLYSYIVTASELPYISSWPALLANNLLDA